MPNVLVLPQLKNCTDEWDGCVFCAKYTFLSQIFIFLWFHLQPQNIRTNATVTTTIITFMPHPLSNNQKEYEFAEISSGIYWEKCLTILTHQKKTSDVSFCYSLQRLYNFMLLFCVKYYWRFIKRWLNRPLWSESILTTCNDFITFFLESLVERGI